MTGFESPASVPHIRLEHRRYEDCPLRLENVISADSYVLFASAKTAQIRVVSEGRVLFDGDFCPGMLWIAEPGERVRVSVMTPAREVVLTIPCFEVWEILEKYEDRGRSRSSRMEPLTQSDVRVAQAVKASFLARDFEGDQRQLFIDGIAYSMLACLLAGPARSVHIRVRSQGQALSDQELSRCFGYADAMIGARLDLRAWAAVLGMSATEFTERFRQATHETPYAWFLSRRVDRAKILLQDRRMSIVDVALALGFCSQSHFTEAFRRRVGFSPARWRGDLYHTGSAGI